MEDKIKAKLDDMRPMLMADGGNMELIAIEGYTVKLKMVGACGSCPSSTMTIKMGIERTLQEEVDPNIVVERV